MKRRIWIIVLTIIVCITGVCSTAWARQRVPAAVLRGVRSVVRIVAEYPKEYATGTGFVIQKDREQTLIATNYHVVEGSPRAIGVVLDADTEYEAEILAYSAQYDCCILRLSESIDAKPLNCSASRARQGDVVYAVGFPGASDDLYLTAALSWQDATVTDGIVSAVRTTKIVSGGQDVRLLQINADINPGNSGGPLFDEHGNVVGVNTFGMASAQGVNGAIDIEVLEKLANEHNVKIRHGNALSGVLWLGAAIVLAAAAFFVMRKRVRRPNGIHALRDRKENVLSNRAQTLDAYMKRFPNGLDEKDAAELLLPLAAQLQKMQRDGKLCLTLSPETVTVRRGRAYYRPRKKTEQQFVVGYTAPEVVRGEMIGVTADVYSFCALALYAASGASPCQIKERGRNASAWNMSDAYFFAVAHGLQSRPEKRYPNMEAVIDALSQLETQRQLEQPQNIPAKPLLPERTAVKAEHSIPKVQKKAVRRKQKRRLPALAKIAIALCSTVLLCIAAYVGSVFMVYHFADEQQFNTARKWLVMPAVTRLHDADLARFVDAGLLLEMHDYDGATAMFKELGEYRGADEMLLEVRYQRAAYLVEQGAYGDAIEVYEDLVEISYKDAKQRLQNAYCAMGEYYLRETHEYAKADGAFSRAKGLGAEVDALIAEANYLWAMELIAEKNYDRAYRKLSLYADGYMNADQILNELKPYLYEEAITAYYDGDYEKSEQLLKRIDPYDRNQDYLALIEIAEGYWCSDEGKYWYSGDGRSTALTLKRLFDFADANIYILREDGVACEFLSGTWRSYDGYYYFSMTRDNHTSYNLPNFDLEGHYRISDGIYILSDEAGNTRNLFEFTLLTPDSMNVYCYANGRTYTLYR